MEVKARIRNVPVPPRKARLVADMVRGHYIDDALNLLAVTHKAISPVIRKLIKSAVANAQSQDANIDEGRLFVKTIFVDEGMTRKWFRPRSRGIANRILHRRSHITVMLEEVNDGNED